MDVDWPLTGLVVVGLLAVTLLFRLLAHVAGILCSAIRTAAGRDRREPRARLNRATLDLSERSSL